ncbi:MAG TPA: caspase family protein [Allocoleopsis sp.]
MSHIKRRQFLQVAASTLATIGLSQLDFLQQSHRYAQVLAQSTPRKLALLVGINAYPGTLGFGALHGCLTDVELQRQLLIYRFGFNPNDIHTLTDKQATRQGILEAFEEHLIRQAKPGDVVVFHYSGHGSQVSDPDGDNPDKLNGTFVPIDAFLPSGFPNTGGVVQDIMGHTLFLLMSAVQSENLTVVLDSCFSGGGTRGNVRIRSRDGGAQLEISPTEKAYQEQWLSRLKLSPQAFIQQRRAGVAKGVVIASTQRDQTATDAPFNDFYAGAFTYLMTQYLWEQTGTVGNAIANITRDIKPFSRQVPLADVKPQSGYDRKPIYFIDPQNPAAEAVITEVTGNTAKLWLGGLDRESLPGFNKNATFTVLDAKGHSAGKVILVSRQGLTGEATVQGTAQPGAFLQEAGRAIRGDLKLRIGLDSSLEGDINSAKQVLQGMNRIEAVNVPYPGEVQYLLGRVTAGDGKGLSSPKALGTPAQTLPPVGSIGLFSPGKDEQLPDSFGEPGETITAAVKRLEPKLTSLLAVHLLKTTLNANSSRLKVAVSMLPEAGKEMIAEAFTPRSGITKERATGLSERLNLGTPFQFRVTNEESRPLYLTILSVDPTGGLTVLFPHSWRASEDVTRLDAGQTLLVPNPATDDFQLVPQAKGIGEVLIIVSITPPKKALLSLQSLAAELKQERGPLVPAQPIEVIGDLLDDLSGERGIGAVEREVDTAEMATLSLTFEVI